MLGNELYAGFIDTGSTVSLIREDSTSSYKPEKTESTDVTMRIILNDDIPVYQPARRLSYAEKQIVNKHIEEWIEQGIIRPSSSEYASPIVLVKKKNGNSRLFVDYRQLNHKRVKDRFPLPLIDDVLDRLQRVKVYTTLDLKNGFFHVDVNEDCRKFTSFTVPDGQFEFNKVPFGLSTSPSVFQRNICSIFWNLMNEGLIIIYMDDLIIPSVDEEEGLRKLRAVLEVASKYGLEIQFKKCQFLKRKIIHSFLNNPETKLLENSKKSKRPVQSYTFSNLGRTELHTDASQQVYGAVLFQEQDDGRLHPVYYMSKKTNTAKEKYSSYELEVLAIVSALKKLRVYLLGQKVKIVTDYSAFQKTMGKKDLITRIARWAMLLEEFDYEIIHRPGQRMKHVDALSRYLVMVLSDTQTLRLKNAQSEDEGIVTLKALLDIGNSQDFFERNEILYKFVNGR
ncbi:hypothetical protein TNCV_1768861 [Trichonephila clavipes]|nr:hypothetical protein TNCV_1768861 [Trichonephila clavipes]